MRWQLNRTCVLLLVFIANSLGLFAAMQAAQMQPKFKMTGKTVNLSKGYVAVKCQNGDKIREDRLRGNAEVQAVSDPHDSKHIVADWVGGQNITTSTSFNGGKSWSAARPLRLNACLNPALSDYKAGADPGVGFGPGRTLAQYAGTVNEQPAYEKKSAILAYAMGVLLVLVIVVPQE